VLPIVKLSKTVSPIVFVTIVEWSGLNEPLRITSIF